MNYRTIKNLEGGEGIRVITLNRPERRNAISIEMRRELCHCLAELKDDDSVRVVVFTGAGRAFCAGFDLREFGRPELWEELVKTSKDYHRDLWNFPKPTVAAVNGPAMAGGLDLAVFCDIRLCSERAVFAHLEIKLGAAPIFTPLRWIVGDGLARDLCLTGRPIDAAEALRIGLVSEVLPADDLLPRALEFARMIVEAPAETLRFTKEFMNANLGADFEESFRREHDEVFDRKYLPKG